MKVLLASGSFDDIARDRVNQVDGVLDRGEFQGMRNVNMQIHDAAAIPSLIDEDRRSRQSAYRPRSMEEIQQDPTLGIKVRTVSDDDFFGQPH